MELDWDEVDSVLQKHIKHKPSFEDGLTEIKKTLQFHSINKVFNNIDKERIQSQFSYWLTELLKQEPIPRQIKSIYFGLFSMVDPNNAKNGITTIHFTGSPFTPKEDDDWACEVDNSFLPENRYLVLDDFVILDENINSIDVDAEVEVLAFNGVLNLLILHCIEKTRKLFLSNHKTLYIGSGYDSGDTYVIGRLKNRELI